MDGGCFLSLLSQIFSLSQMIKFTLTDFTTTINILTVVRLGFQLRQFNISRYDDD